MAIRRSYGEKAIQRTDTDGNPLTVFDFTPPAWIADANCAGTDPEAFFPDKGGSTREAKKICARCTVSAECLERALDMQERFGIYGGKSDRERRKIARDRAAQDVA